MSRLIERRLDALLKNGQYIGLVVHEILVLHENQVVLVARILKIITQLYSGRLINVLQLKNWPMFWDKQIAAVTLLVLIFALSFTGTIPKVSSQGNITSGEKPEKAETVPIKNSEVLQACVTALVGILIFLTLEFCHTHSDIKYARF
jgi:hypothetical protein